MVCSCKKIVWTKELEKTSSATISSFLAGLVQCLIFHYLRFLQSSISGETPAVLVPFDERRDNINNQCSWPLHLEFHTQRSTNVILLRWVLSKCNIVETNSLSDEVAHRSCIEEHCPRNEPCNTQPLEPSRKIWFESKSLRHRLVLIEFTSALDDDLPCRWRVTI